MKPIYKILAILFVFFNFSCAGQRRNIAQQEYVNFDVFYNQLSPYGEWVDYPNYGYVWIPDIDRNFSPYSTAGYWVMTDYGWTWVSDYDWGWAPFHYGRWDFDDYYGWFWVPDNEWGPSWVTWRSANGYYGWTPMRPGMNINTNFNDGYRNWNHWNFVRDRDFGRSDINRYYINRNEYNTIIINSTVINNTYVDKRRNTTYISGPTRANVQRTTGRRITNVSIRDNDRPGQALNMNNNQLRIYRPQVERIDDRNQRPAPSKITNLKDVKPARERNATEQQNSAIPLDNDRRNQPQIERQKQEQRIQEQQIEKRNQEPQQKNAQPEQQIERQKIEQQRSQQRQQIEQQRQQPQRERRRKEPRREAQPVEQKEQQREETKQLTPQQQIVPQQQQQQQQQQERQKTTEPSNNKRRNR